MDECQHPEFRCINEYELIRKYRCESCGAIAMCACDEVIGRRHLAHQLEKGCVLESQERVPVTLGFVTGICRECRGLPAEAHPMAPVLGSTSKIKRYYWREIQFREMELFAEWATANGLPLDAHGPEIVRAHADARERALAEIMELHASAPKYQFAEKSQREVIEEFGVEVLDLDAAFLERREGEKAQIVDGDARLTVEQFVARHYERQGFQVMPLESTPIHALFGVFMWIVVQDPDDPGGRIVSFGDRTAFDDGADAKEIWTSLPSDFGSPGYLERRRSAIDEHFSETLGDPNELLDLFDHWDPCSEELRQYLWAHRRKDVERARRLVEVLPGDVVLSILRYLIGDYWCRYLGWPDLFAWRGEELLLVEVKGSRDKLSEDQKRWIEDNHEVLGLPFVIAKVHRRAIRPRC